LKQAGLAGLIMMTAVNAWAADVVCLAETFPDGLQTHSPQGGIHIGFNSQLLNNPDPILGTPTLTQNGGSTLFSCGTEDCVASTNTSAQILPGFELTASNSKLTVGWNTLAVFGENNVRQYGTITLNSLGSNQWGQVFDL